LYNRLEARATISAAADPPILEEQIVTMKTGRFSVEKAVDPNLGEIMVMMDAESGAVASVSPAAGGNLYRFAAPVNGRMVEAFIGPKAGEKAGFGFGNPILFPFANRIRDAHFAFGGKDVQLDKLMNGMTLHGFVAKYPWTVEQAEATAKGAVVKVSFLSSSQPEVTRQWPFPFKVAVTYTLAGGTFEMLTEATNVGDSAMPMSFGIHGWIPLPLVAHGRREDCVVKIPAAKQWEVEPALLPTGKVIDVPAEKDFRTPRALGTTWLDDPYTGVVRANGQIECSVYDPAAGATVAVRADDAHREIVVFAPPSRATICFEPYSGTTDSFNLQPKGVDAGLVVVEPGKTWSGRIWFDIRAGE
jgi:aldose 1-epimerase